ANDEFCRVVGPQHDIDLLAAQFIAHGGYTRTAHADTCADGIDELVISHNGNFSAHTRITGSRLDLEQALLDFGNFVLEELADEFGCRTRQDDLLTAGGMVDLHDPGTNAVAHADVLARNHLGTRKACLDLACI